MIHLSNFLCCVLICLALFRFLTFFSFFFSSFFLSFIFLSFLFLSFSRYILSVTSFKFLSIHTSLTLYISLSLSSSSPPPVPSISPISLLRCFLSNASLSHHSWMMGYGADWWMFRAIFFSRRFSYVPCYEGHRTGCRPELSGILSRGDGNY